MSLYGGSKAALRHFVRSWISEVKERAVRINVLSSGAIDTPSLRNALARASGEENVEREVKRMGQGNPLGRLGAPARNRQSSRLPLQRRLELRHGYRTVRRRWHGPNRLAQSAPDPRRKGAVVLRRGSAVPPGGRYGRATSGREHSVTDATGAGPFSGEGPAPRAHQNGSEMNSSVGLGLGNVPTLGLASVNRARNALPCESRPW